MHKRLNKQNGFTLLELLIVIGIFTILIGVSWSAFNNWQGAAKLEAAGDELVENLKMASVKSLAGYQDGQYGIYINAAQKSYVFFQGDDYNNRITADDQTVILDDNFSLSSNLNGNEIVFSKGAELPSTAGTITINDFNTGKLKQVNVNKAGLIDEN
jgi:prepilin-type N-terminal cleavage/methylation domain-containing protein